MKPAGPSLLYLALAAALAAQPADPAPPARTSGRLTEEIRAGLPKFTAPATSPAGKDEPASSDPDLLVLPKFTVKEKRIPANDPDVWLSRRSVQQKAMAAYQGSMTPLEWALNSWFVPLFSAPRAVRARAAYESARIADEMNRLNHLAKVVETVDPQQAAKIRRAMDPNILPKDD